ncbi:MAG: HlyD family efflux transporter periplasmic adaptor subunit [Pseudomonadota bacterium]|nr:HlyD family efflux transporter periplasmic adaptor subunit [Pseudomonadota bacterium]
MNHLAAAVAAVTLLLSACHAAPPDALGSLEYDRISLPAPAAERIEAIAVREGQVVAAGEVLMMLDASRAQAQTDAALAQAGGSRDAAQLAERGARSEAIAQARAQLAAAQAQAAEATSRYRRLEPLGRQRLVAAIDVDTARAAAQTAAAQVQVAQQALDTLTHGNRPEEIAQARAAQAAAEAQAQAQQVTLGKLTVTAPRAGRIDSLPFKPGDQPGVGAPLAVMLVGDAPHARIYVPERLRPQVKVGDAATIEVEGQTGQWQGTVRMIRSEPAFTPYFALTGDDAARLSYLAEVQLGPDAAELPAGLPVRVHFSARP